MIQEQDYLIKLCVIGNRAVGKSSLQFRFTNNNFCQHYLLTQGRRLGGSKTFESNGSIVKLHIWDAVHQRNRTMISSYYKETHGIIFVYDIANRQSFENIGYWLAQAIQYGALKVPKLLVGNKSDLEDEREVKPEEGRDLADSLGMNFLETSAKEAVNVEKAFTILSKEIKLKGIVQKKEKKND